MRVFAYIATLIMLAIPVTALADFSAGMRAYKAGAYSTAFDRWQPLAAEGDAKSQNNIGILFRHGLGVDKNPTEAANWYRKAAEQDFAKAQFNLGLLYKLGLGVPKDPAKALYWDFKSAENGYYRAQFAIGLRHERGDGVDKDAVEALKWLYLALNTATGKLRHNVSNARDRILLSLTSKEIQRARRLLLESKVSS